MKKTISITLASIILSFMYILTIVEKSEAMSLYDFKNAKIILKSINPMSETIQEIDVGEGGIYVKQKTTTEMDALGMKRKEIQISYIDREKDMVYNYNPDTNEASAMNMSGMMGGMMGEMQEFSEKSLEKFGGKVIGEEKYQGLDCTVVEFADFMSTVWFHKKYPVKTMSNMGGMEILTELVSFKEGAAKDYRLPSNAKITQKQSVNDVMKDVMRKMNPSQNPEYEEDQEQRDSDYDPEDQMDEPGAMEKAMEALSGVFGNE